jgi:arginase
MYKFIGAACGWGAQIQECEQGPKVLLNNEHLLNYKELGISIKEHEIIWPNKTVSDSKLDFEEVLSIIYSFNHKLADCVYDTLKRNLFPIIIGGDHSVAIGTWRGVLRALFEKDPRPLGLLWVDAHMDAHTPQTSPSNAVHGMPLASLLGYGAIPQIQPLTAFQPENICLIGIRSYEEGEAKLLRKLGVRIFFIEEVHKRGFKTCLREALEIVNSKTQGFGLSLDLDVIDSKEVSYVGSPERNGISISTLLNGLEILRHHSQLRAIEFVEYNPSLDINKEGDLLIPHLFESLLSSRSAPSLFVQ